MVDRDRHNNVIQVTTQLFPRSKIFIKVKNINYSALIDTGATVCLVSHNCVKNNNYLQKLHKYKSEIETLSSVTQEDFQVLYEIRPEIRIGPLTANVPCLVVDKIKHDFILGTPFFEATRMIIDFEKQAVIFTKDNRVFSWGNTSIPPKSVKIINVVSPHKIKSDQNHLLSIVPVPQNIHYSRQGRPVLSKNITTKDSITKQNYNSKKKLSVMQVVIANPTKTYKNIRAGTPIGIIQHVAQNDYSFQNKIKPEVGHINTTKPENTQQKSKHQFDLSKSVVNEKAQNDIKNLLAEFDDVFAGADETCVKPANFPPVRIPLIDNYPIVYSHPYKTTVQEQEELSRQLDALLKADVIERSESAFNSPIILIRKRDSSIRFCCDLRKINAIIRNDVIAVADDINDIFQHLGKVLRPGSVMSTLDLRSSYHQIRIHQDDCHILGFTANNKRYQWRRCPFGLKNSGMFLKKALTEALGDLMGNGLYVYVDDILIIGEDAEAHLKLLREVLTRLRKYNFILKPSKCIFAVEEVDFLGYKLSRGTIRPQDSKIKSVQEAIAPKTKRDLRSFIGLISFNRRWIQNFSQKAKPLYELLKSKSQNKIDWPQEAQEAFQNLKLDLINASNLHLPRPDWVYHLYTDASKDAIGFSLYQGPTTEPENLVPLSHGGRILSDTEKRYAITHLEFLAVVASLQAIEPYARSSKIVIYSDHSSLIHFMKNSAKSNYSHSRISRWVLYLGMFPHLEIKYIKGDSQVADYLSRYIFQEGQLVREDHKEDERQEAAIQKVIDAATILSCEISQNQISQKQKLQNHSDMSALDIDITALKRIQNSILEPRQMNKEAGNNQLIKADQIEQNIVFSEDQLVTLQENDAFIKLVKDFIENKNDSIHRRTFDRQAYLLSIDCYITDNGLVKRFCRNTYKGNRNCTNYIQTLLPQCLRLNVIHSVHSVAHAGIEKCLSEIRETYFWNNMYNDIKNVIQACTQCQQFQHRNIKSRAPLYPHVISKYMYRFAIDHIGPLISSQGFKYILICKEIATGWILTKAMHSTDSDSCARFIINEIIYKFGLFQELFQDNASSFTSNVFKAVLNQLNIKQIFSPPYYSQANGSVESSVKVISNALKRAVKGRPNTWNKYLQPITFAVNCSIHMSTGYSPYKLLYGRDPNLCYKPVVQDGSNIPGSETELYSELQTVLESVTETLEQNIKQYKSHMKSNYDKNSKESDFKEHDLVWVYTRSPIPSRKFQPHYSGPYTLRQKIDHVIWKVSVSHNSPIIDRLIHENQLKKYFFHNLQPLYNADDLAHIRPVQNLIPPLADTRMPYDAISARKEIQESPEAEEKLQSLLEPIEESLSEDNDSETEVEHDLPQIDPSEVQTKLLPERLAKRHNYYYRPKHSAAVKHYTPTDAQINAIHDPIQYTVIGYFNGVEITETAKITFSNCSQIVEQSPPIKDTVFYKVLLDNGKYLWTSFRCLNKTIVNNIKYNSVQRNEKFEINPVQNILLENHTQRKRT